MAHALRVAERHLLATLFVVALTAGVVHAQMPPCGPSGCGSTTTTFPCDSYGCGPTTTLPCGPYGCTPTTLPCGPYGCGPVCGDGACEDPETPWSCPQDCGTCGNGICDPAETASSCADCGCGDGYCRPDDGEDAATCPADCSGPCTEEFCCAEGDPPAAVTGPAAPGAEFVDMCRVNFTEIWCPYMTYFVADVAVRPSFFIDPLPAGVPDTPITFTNVASGHVVHLSADEICLRVTFNPITILGQEVPWPFGANEAGVCVKYGVPNEDGETMRYCWGRMRHWLNPEAGDIQPGTGTNQAAVGPLTYGMCSGGAVIGVFDFNGPEGPDPDGEPPPYRFRAIPDCSRGQMIIELWDGALTLTLKTVL